MAREESDATEDVAQKGRCPECGKLHEQRVRCLETDGELGEQILPCCEVNRPPELCVLVCDEMYF